MAVAALTLAMVANEGREPGVDVDAVRNHMNKLSSSCSEITRELRDLLTPGSRRGGRAHGA